MTEFQKLLPPLESVAGRRAELQGLCDEYTKRLSDLHDDYVHTRMLWRDLQVRVLRAKENRVFHNPTTGTVTEGSQLAGQALTALQRLGGRCFKDMVGQFELFVGELLRLWLCYKPALLSEKAITIAILLASQDLVAVQAAAVSEAIESTIADKMYGRPEKWFNFLKKNLAVRFTADEEGAFIEMKARRDVLEHKGGIIEATYFDKTKGAAKYKVGDHVRPNDADVNEVYQLVQKLIRTTTESAIASLAST